LGWLLRRPTTIIEIELKFQVPTERRARVLAEVGQAGKVRAQRLQAAYFDTPGRDLARAGIALRLRREGRTWVQTLKGQGADALTRLEHNVPRGYAAAMPALDLGLHAGSVAGAALEQALAGLNPADLLCQYRTDVRRTARRVRTRQGTIELAFDEGRIFAGSSPDNVEVCELEIELISGSSLAVITTARRWVARYGLWLDVRTKAERGDLLARGIAVRPAVRAQEPDLPALATVGQAEFAVLTSCIAQILGNASPVAAGTFNEEHVHQLRVGLRRLRTALKLFARKSPGEAPPDATEGDAPDVAQLAAALFRRLGAARDAAAIGAPMQASLRAALAQVGMPAEMFRLPIAEGLDPTLVLREASTQGFWLDLLTHQQQLGMALSAEAVGATLWRDTLARTLSRWQRKLADGAKAFASSDDEARHRLRKRAKAMRYALEFAQGLYPHNRARSRYMKALRDMQERLGDLNDNAVAIDACRAAPQGDLATAFALGWLVSRREVLLTECAPSLKAFGRVKAFWG